MNTDKYIIRLLNIGTELEVEISGINYLAVQLECNVFQVNLRGGLDKLLSSLCLK